MDLGIVGRWALVCGASKGLGYGCAQALVREGVHVVVAARTPGPLAEAVQRLQGEAAQGAQVLGVAADVTTPEGRAQVLGLPGGPGRDFDILVTNAGGPPPGDFRDWDRDIWLKALDANMLSPIELIKATVDGMMARGFGRIVNITSSAVKAPIDILGLSNGARSGLTGFVAGLARANVSRGVTTNNQLPGQLNTDRLTSNFETQARKTGQTVEQVRAARTAAHPARRLGHADEFGATCAFLCSQHAGYINGQNVLIDGGGYPGTF